MAGILTGYVRHSVDDKNRTRIPAKFKEVLTAPLYFVPADNDCILLLPEQRAKEMMERSRANISVFDTDAQNPTTFLLSHTYEVKEDGQGRITLPSDLKKMAQIDKDLVFVGKFDYAEIWAAETWERKFSVLEKGNLSAMIAKLKSYGL
ncbi:protein MraZ [Acidaminococcus sp. CAG:917]|nr:protein MraZ [Acidaminococcus sp. CAG:917]